MSFDWREFLILAHQLIGSGKARANQESHRRSSISRAYYAAFCAARDNLPSSAAIPPTGEAHQKVPKCYERTPGKLNKRIATNLRRLRDARRKADYDDAVTGLASLATVSVQRAEQLFSDLGP